MKNFRPALVLTLFFILFCGLLFPAVIYGIAQAAFPKQANGSLVHAGDQVVGSELIGQSFAAPKYFHPRPSAAGNGYDANNSGGTNLAVTSSKLLEGDKDFDGIKQLAAKYREENGLGADAVLPVDAVTRSASGLDPHISPENAALQAPRVAKARGMSEASVKEAIRAATEAPLVGVFGEPRVNVLKLNLSLDQGAH